MYAIVTFPISSFKTFIYNIPKKNIEEIHPGVCVNAPINNRLQIGFVVSIKNTPGFKGKILSIDSIRDKELHIPTELWNTLNWISKYYMCPFGKVIKTAIPNTFTNIYRPKHIQYVQILDNGRNQLKLHNSFPPAQLRVLKFLEKIQDPIKVSSLSKITSSPNVICKKLCNKEFVKVVLQPKITDPFDIMTPCTAKNIKLSSEQQHIFKKIINTSTGFQPFLMHGVTGSGKTEVYLKLAQKIVQCNKSVLVLVPEISLTPQVAKRFRSAFGKRVALWHSKMSKAEKGWTWQQLKQGAYSVVVGARSAIFSPLRNIGLIIIDEEQEFSYKQENTMPRYHARDVAIVRGKNANANVLLASATPSLESYYNAIQKKFHLLELKKRYGQSVYPSIEIVNMKMQSVNSQENILSSNLKKAIDDRLKKSEQIIILQNRRGYNLIQTCNDCGQVKTCNNCSITMTYHKTDNALHCHHCESITQLDSFCNNCESKNIMCVGAGTQKIEDVLNKEFNGIKILRMDIDTVRNKGAHEKILTQFSQGKANILLGTQMIAKGLDFANVTLVGVINADSGLFLPDFRAGERVFQLIYQVAGRSGRRSIPGHAIIQTYNPNDVYIQAASTLNIKKFYNIAMAQRQELNYPPFSRIARILFLGKNKNKVTIIAKKTCEKLLSNTNYEILGPSLAPFEKINNMWRSHIIIKTPKNKKRNIYQFIEKRIGRSIIEKKWLGVRIQIDIDPISMM